MKKCSAFSVLCPGCPVGCVKRPSVKRCFPLPAICGASCGLLRGFCGPSPWPVDEAHTEAASPVLRGICTASGAVGAAPSCVLLPVAMFNDRVLETHRGRAPCGRGLALLPRDLSTGIGSQLCQGSGAGVSRLSHAVGYVKLNSLTQGTPPGELGMSNFVSG
jgi:hypothetical protein